MRFTCIPNLGKSGGGLVWDKETNKVLATFDSNGEFATDDDAVALKLIDLGFKEILTEAAPENKKPSKQKKWGGKREE